MKKKLIAASTLIPLVGLLTLKIYVNRVCKDLFAEDFEISFEVGDIPNV